MVPLHEVVPSISLIRRMLEVCPIIAILWGYSLGSRQHCVYLGAFEAKLKWIIWFDLLRLLIVSILGGRHP